MIRPVLIAIATLLLAPAALADSIGEWPSATPESSVWNFRVMLDRKDIGYHRFEVRRDGTREEVDIEARFKVKILFVTAYRYAHDNLERWNDNCLAAIESETDDNGDRYALSGEKQTDGFGLVLNAEPQHSEAPCLQTFAYWNPQILEAERLLNAQTGKVQDINVRYLGAEAFELADQVVQADSYLLSTDAGDITLWYEQDSRRWLGLETLTAGDRVLRYVPESLPPTGDQLAQR